MPTLLAPLRGRRGNLASLNASTSNSHPKTAAASHNNFVSVSTARISPLFGHAAPDAEAPSYRCPVHSEKHPCEGCVFLRPT